jgi:hypothetical protein
VSRYAAGQRRARRLTVVDEAVFFVTSDIYSPRIFHARKEADSDASTEICMTGHQVETDIDSDPQSFAGLPRDITTLTCPHCERPHLLAHVAWLGELQSEYE